jgi:hypothetical protein
MPTTTTKPMKYTFERICGPFKPVDHHTAKSNKIMREAHEAALDSVKMTCRLPLESDPIDTRMRKADTIRSSFMAFQLGWIQGSLDRVIQGKE